MPQDADRSGELSRGLLSRIERLGNLLPDPIFLFVGATVLVIALSALVSAAGWSVQPVRPETVAGTAGLAPLVRLVESGTPITARSLASSDGVFWLTSNLVRNFMNFAPLGVILVCMLGIGVAEHTGLFSTTIRLLGGVIPARALTPAVIMMCLLAHIGADSGFIVLPPLVAGLYAACGRSPVAGVAVAYAAVAGGYSANLLLTPSDALMAPLTERGARILDARYSVGAPCNWYFLAASAVVLTLAGWWVTSRIVEPRLARQAAPEIAGPEILAPVTPAERRSLGAAVLALLCTLGLVALLILVPGAPLYGAAPGTDAAPGPARWSLGIVPIIFLVSIVPGLAYGVRAGTVRRLKDVTDAFTRDMVSMAPVIAMSFFAAQFIECFRYSQLDSMLAQAGGQALASAALPRPLLVVALVVVVLCLNMLVPSMSAKWTALSGVVVPMLMMAGISPELSQAAYRVGDSVTNPVTPFNAYIIIALAVVQRYRREAGIGTVLSLTAPYAVAFFIAWTGLLLVWLTLGLPLGPGGPLWYTPGSP